jgi:hypothetical protein
MRSAEDLRARWLDLIAAVMERTGMYAATGREMQLLAGRLLADLCFLDDRDADGEQELSRLGYLPIASLVSAERWQEMTAGLRGHFEDHDVSQGEAVRILGEPSLVVDRRVLAYAPADPAPGWLFIDCHAERASRYDVGHGRYTAVRDAEPLVRSVRVSGLGFEAGLILTLYGKTLRWGPGWWTDHPSENWPAETAAIAAQLRQVSAADPSQSLRGPGR